VAAPIGTLEGLSILDGTNFSDSLFADLSGYTVYVREKLRAESSGDSATFRARPLLVGSSSDPPRGRDRSIINRRGPPSALHMMSPH
jgi:hypothetical protein